MTFERVLVVGAGQMGGGIAQVVAASGRGVFLQDEVPGAVERALAAMEKSLARLAEKGGPDPAEVLERLPVHKSREGMRGGRHARRQQGPNFVEQSAFELGVYAACDPQGGLIGRNAQRERDNTVPGQRRHR